MTSIEQVGGVVEMSRALNMTGLAEVLRDDEDGGSTQYTVFAPSDSAFNNYSLPFNVSCSFAYIHNLLYITC